MKAQFVPKFWQKLSNFFRGGGGVDEGKVHPLIQEKSLEITSHPIEFKLAL